MKTLTLQEACIALAIDTATLYRWMERAQMQAETDAYDKRRRSLTLAQVQQLARMHHRPLPKTVKAESLDTETPQRLATVEQEVQALRQQVDTLTAQLDTLSSAFRGFANDVQGQLAARPAIVLQQPAPKILRPPKAEYIPSATPETGQGLPEGYSAFTEWCERHKIAETTARRKINPDNLKKGHWKDADGNLVKVAIDQAGQHHLWEIFHGKTHFQPCEQCPHG